MPEVNDQNRTEAPTQRRLQRAKEAGQVAVSPEISILASLATGVAVLVGAGPFLLNRLTADFAILLQHLETPPLETVHLLLPRIAVDVAPLVVLPALAAVLATGAQTGFSISFAPLRPDFQRIDPAAGLRRLLAPQNLIETVKALCKLLAVSFILWRTAVASFDAIPPLLLHDPHLILPALRDLALRFVLSVLGVQLVVAIFDIAWARFSLLRSLRMTIQEVKDEIKETEGDPLLKSRLRRLRYQRARHRMLAAMSKATVVVTNPTEYAVALAYQSGTAGAPRVVAKGVDFLAAKIREIARENAIPIVPNPPLARALYLVEIDAEIPAHHYKAVAEIIAYVWRLRDRIAQRKRLADSPRTRLASGNSQETDS